MPSRRAQVLPQGEDFDPRVQQVAHRLTKLVWLLAVPEHDGALGDEARGRHARVLEHRERLAVPCAPVTHRRLQPLDRLDVVRVHVQTRARDGGDALEARGAVEVGREALEAHRRLQLLDSPHRPRVVLCAAVGDVVAIDGRDDDVVDLPRGNGLGGLLGLVGGRQRRPA